MVGGKIYRVLELITSLVFLNLVWLLACLPILTVWPATTALFGIVRRWVRGEEPPVLRTFFSLFKEDLGRSLLVGAVWLPVGAVLVADFLLIGQMESLRRPLYVLLLAFALLYASATVYLFPVLANYEASWRTAIKNALLFSMVRPWNTAQGLLVVAVAAFATASFPPLALLVSGSATAYCVYFFCDRTFREVEKARDTDRRS